MLLEALFRSEAPATPPGPSKGQSSRQRAAVALLRSSKHLIAVTVVITPRVLSPSHLAAGAGSAQGSPAKDSRLLLSNLFSLGFRV